MSTASRHTGFAGRIVAALVALACIAAIAWLNRAWLWPRQAGEEAGLNPQFVACRDKRLGDVAAMRDKGVISQTQYSDFSKRAIALCAGRFPPHAGKQ